MTRGNTQADVPLGGVGPAFHPGRVVERPSRRRAAAVGSDSPVNLVTTGDWLAAAERASPRRPGGAGFGNSSLGVVYTLYWDRKENAMDADQIVRDFCAAWSRGDVDTILDAFTEDAVYHNIPMEPCNGKEAIRAFIEGFLGTTASGVAFDIRHQLVSGNVVMNERVDTLKMEAGDIALPVCGVFELTPEGKIAHWRDYFDMAPFAALAD
jgi:limonene-1,2-epoxide hydrolase